MTKIKYILSVIFIIIILKISYSQNNECFDYSIEKCIKYKNNSIVFSSNMCVNKINSTERTTNIRVALFDSLFIKKWEVFLDSTQKSTLQDCEILNNSLVIILNEEYNIIDSIHKRKNFRGRFYKINLNDGEILNSKTIDKCIIASQIINNHIVVFGNEIIRKEHSYDDLENTDGVLMKYNDNLELLEKQPFLNNFSYGAFKFNSLFTFYDKNKMFLMSRRIKEYKMLSSKICLNYKNREWVFAIEYFNYNDLQKKYISDSIVCLDCKYFNSSQLAVDMLNRKAYYGNYIVRNDPTTSYKYDLDLRTKKINETKILANKVYILENGDFAVYEMKTRFIKIYSCNNKLKKTYNVNNINLNRKDFCFYETNKNLFIVYVFNNQIFFEKIHIIHN